MTKMFCDVCGEEMKDSNRLTRKRLKIQAQVIVGLESTGGGVTWNAPHVCHKCVMAILTDGTEVVQR